MFRSTIITAPSPNISSRHSTQKQTQQNMLLACLPTVFPFFPFIFYYHFSSERGRGVVKLLFLTFARARGCRTKPEQALSSRSHWAFCSSVSRMFVQTQLSPFLTVLLSESRSSKILSVCEHVQHAAPPPPTPTPTAPNRLPISSLSTLTFFVVYISIHCLSHLRGFFTMAAAMRQHKHSWKVRLLHSWQLTPSVIFCSRWGYRAGCPWKHTVLLARTQPSQRMPFAHIL